MNNATMQEFSAKKALIESTLPTLCAAENLFFKSLEYSVQANDGEATGETVTLQFDGAIVTLDVSKMSIANIAIAVLQKVA